MSGFIDISGYFNILQSLINSFSKHSHYLTEILNEYHSVIHSSNKTIEGEGTEETFVRDITLLNSNFSLAWNIEKWPEVNGGTKTKVKTVPTKSIYGLLHPETIALIDKQKALNLPDNVVNNPVLVVPWPYSETNQLLIDGHHRVFRKNRKNKLKTSVYFLNEEQSIDMMVSQLYRNLYRVTVSIIRLSQCLNRQVNECNIYRFDKSDPSKVYKQDFKL